MPLKAGDTGENGPFNPVELEEVVVLEVVVVGTLSEDVRGNDGRGITSGVFAG